VKEKETTKTKGGHKFYGCIFLERVSSGIPDYGIPGSPKRKPGGIGRENVEGENKESGHVVGGSPNTSERVQPKGSRLEFHPGPPVSQPHLLRRTTSKGDRLAFSNEQREMAHLEAAKKVCCH